MTKIKIILVAYIFISTVLASQYDYPETRFEREMKKMGSLAGEDGIKFGVKDNSRKDKSRFKVRKNGSVFIFKSSIEILKFAPLVSADSNAGIVITDWYYPEGEKKTQFKITVNIIKDDLSEDAFEVIAFERKKGDSGWHESKKSSAISHILKEKILKKAEELYLKA